jgi:5-methylcytosine-specific restriction endonuclease McrA
MTSNRDEERYARFREKKDQISRDFFGGKCFLCGRTDNYQEYHLHHIEYDPEESNYDTHSRAFWTRVRRLKEATEHPERFRLLCQSCHRLITSLGNTLVNEVRVSHRTIETDKLIYLLDRELQNRLEKKDGPNIHDDLYQ